MSDLLRLAVAALALLAAAAAPAARAAAPKAKAYTAKALAGTWSGTAKGPIPVPNTAFVCDSVNYKVTYTGTTFSVRGRRRRREDVQAPAAAETQVPKLEHTSDHPHTHLHLQEAFECVIGALKVPLSNKGKFTVAGSSIKRSGCSNLQLCAGTLGITKASATGLTLKSSVLGGKSLALKKAAVGRR